MQLRVFIVDDEADYARLLQLRLRSRADLDIQIYGSGEAALAHLDEDPDLVLLDVVMPGMGGLETLRELKARRPHLPVVMVSAQSVVRVALEAMQLGATDYLTKGHDDLVKLDAVVEQVAERARLARELERLHREVGAMKGLDRLIGESPAMVQVLRMIEKALRGDLAVVIQGESGTGKELVAEAIHYNSSRRRGPFVVVNCAAVPRELMESEFFGHEKGSFTGAYARKIGKFEQADGGTIFLDEIGELDLDLQAKLLRVLQNQEIQRVGGSKTVKVDARVLSATNRDIPAMVRAGTFREDLYYRLYQFPIHLPPLRERGQDVLLLADHFMKTYLAAHPQFAGKRLGAEARRALLRYAWPGNVRELKSAIERAILIADLPEIQPDDLMLGEGALQTAPAMPPAVGPAVPPAPDVSPGPMHWVRQGWQREDDIVPLEDLKRMALEHAYALCGGNVDRTALRLGVTRSTVYRLLKKYGIARDEG